jgi:DNA-binding NarL/FixJ family response regulator
MKHKKQNKADTIQKDKKTMHNVQHITTISGSDATLSQRETQILESLSNGLSSKHIADALIISKDTVETHRKNILKKLQADNMVQAVAMAIRGKILK